MGRNNMTYTLDGTKMTAKSEAHAYIANVLGFPSYYGKNLDALFDCLCELSKDSEIIITSAHAIPALLGDYGTRLLDVFKEAAFDRWIRLTISE